MKDHPKISFGKTGIILVNLGTPDSTSWFDIRKYLKEFLSDRRVIEVNPIIWQLILNVFILTFRPSKTAKAYKEIWMKKENMSPLRYYTEKQAFKLKDTISNKNIVIDYAMRYGNPSIKSIMEKLQKKGCENLIVLPLYPQYAAATTATVCDEVYRILMKTRWQPSLQIIPHYESEPLYIEALVKSINKKISILNWVPDLIVASYHGIPKKYFEKGDPYHCHCAKTTRLIKEKLKNNIKNVEICFQSRFGPQEWLQPYMQDKFKELISRNMKKICVIAPSFVSLSCTISFLPCFDRVIKNKKGSSTTRSRTTNTCSKVSTTHCSTPIINGTALFRHFEIRERLTNEKFTRQITNLTTKCL